MNCTGLRCTLHSLVIQASPIWAAPRIYDFFMRRENWITQKYNRGNPKLKGKRSHFRFTVEGCPGNNNRLLTESEGRTGGSTAQASSISKFILCHSACDSKMHFRWLGLKGRPPWRIRDDTSSSDKSKLSRSKKKIIECEIVQNLLKQNFKNAL